ncbi:MAG: hypothetical protein FJ138_02450, partial [Deltaproteobacteria bacterium]|nr:hypothetical protein [Deltaproteobacteria bacterium]
MKTHPRHPRRPRLARCGALALLALLAACESTLPSGYSTHDDVGKFIGGLTRTYATGQRVTISFYGEQSQSEDLAVESSDPALLKPIADLDGALEVEGAGPCLGEALCEAPAGEGAPPEAQGAGGVVRQRFELVGEGAASLVFKDGGEVVREVPIRLVKATRVEAHVYYGGAAAKLGGDTRLADGARFVAGRAHKIQLIPYLNDKPLYLSELLTPPTTAGATLEHTYTPLWREGVVLEVRPEALAGDAAEGRPFSLRAALAGVDYALSLQAAPPSAVRDLVVRISRDAPESRVGDDGVTTEVPVAIAFAQGRDEAGAPVYGAEVV